MTQSIRVLVANQPRLMRELVLATLLDQPDIEVLGEVPDEADILPTVQEHRPDFLIVALDNSGARPPVCDVLLSRYPHMKILALAPERNSSVFYWASLDIHCFNVESSAEGVLSTLRVGLKGRYQ